MRHERHEALLSVTIRHERHVCVTLRHEASRDTNKKASKASRCVTERHERYENVTKRYDASRIVTIISVTSVTKVVSMILQEAVGVSCGCKMNSMLTKGYLLNDDQFLHQRQK